MNQRRVRVWRNQRRVRVWHSAGRVRRKTAPTDFEKPYGTRLRYPHRVASLPPGSTLRIAANPTSIAS